MKTKLVGILSIMLGVFLFAGVAAASDANILQPASTITYNEDLIVDGTGTFKSIKIGEQGVGGVTFFQGTIINTTTGEGNSDNPVTFGDNLRIDGKIFRIEEGGDNHLKIADTLMPASSHDLGTSSNRWNKVYAKDASFSGTVTIQGGTVWTSENDGAGSGLNADLLDGKHASAFSLSSHNHDGRYLKLSGGTLTGDLNQSLSKNGAVKAMVNANASGGCNRSWASATTMPIACSKIDGGSYVIDFPFDVNNRYWQATAATTSPIFVSATSYATSSDSMYVNIYTHGGIEFDSDFILNIY